MIQVSHIIWHIIRAL